MIGNKVLGALGACVVAAAAATPALATENGASFYLLGSHGPMAGVSPPPGVYFQTDVYYYQGSTNASGTLPLGGTLVADTKVRLWAVAPTLLWSTPVEILGGNLSFLAVVPVGGPTVDAGVTLASPLLGSVVSRGVHDSIFTVGDPLLGMTLGWHAGNLHWNLGVLVNTPIGDYRPGALANLAFHHWGEDVTAGVTWFDPKAGIELSGAMGLTFNQQNPVTQYRSGTEFHIELAAIRHFANGFAIGPVGYYYHQLSGDSGVGARLGPYRGQVAAIGAYAGYTFHVDQRPVTASVKLFKEFAATNRLDDGFAAYMTLALPLSVQQAPSAPKPITARY